MDSTSSSTAAQTDFQRLYRTGHNRMLGGVCAGLSEHFHFELTLLRIIWVVGTLFWGTGILAYLICWIIIPMNPTEVSPQQQRRVGMSLIGIILIAIGCLTMAGWMLRHFFWLPLPVHFLFIPGSVIVLIFVLAIAFFLLNSKSQPSPAQPVISTPAEPTKEKIMNRLYRSRDQRILSGVCGGLGKYFNLDPTIMRILWVVLGVGSFGTALIIYIILGFIIPEEPMA
jgi:phage shock protein C